MKDDIQKIHANGNIRLPIDIMKKNGLKAGDKITFARGKIKGADFGFKLVQNG